MKFIIISCILTVLILNDAVAVRNKRYTERIVAARQNLKNQMNKSERLIIGNIVPAETNLQNRIGKQERLVVNGIVPANQNLENRKGKQDRLIVDGIVPANQNLENRKDQIKLQYVVKA